MPRRSTVGVNMTAAEKAIVESKAEALGITPSTLCYLILKAATRNLSFFVLDFQDHGQNDLENGEAPEAAETLNVSDEEAQPVTA